MTVAGDGEDTSFAHFVDDFIGPDVVADEVAETVEDVGLSDFYVCKEGFEGGEVGVDVGEQSDFHTILRICNMGLPAICGLFYIGGVMGAIDHVEGEG